MDVVMDGEAAWSVKLFTAAVADVLPRLEIAVTDTRIYGTQGRFRRRILVFGIRIPSEACERDIVECRRRIVLQISAWVPFIQNKLRGDETGSHFRIITPRFQEIFGRG